MIMLEMIILSFEGIESETDDFDVGLVRLRHPAPALSPLSQLCPGFHAKIISNDHAALAGGTFLHTRIYFRAVVCC